MDFKTPPHSTEAEQSVLGALLLDNQAFERVADLLTGEDFYHDKHRRIWRHLSRLIEANKPADTLTVHESIESSEDRGKTDGPAYLGSLAQNTPSAANVRRYAELVREKALLRAVISNATGLAEDGFAPLADPKELIERAASVFTSIEVDRRPAEMVQFGAALTEAVEWADNPVKGLSTGYKGIDNIVGALGSGDLVVIAGRPSMGKTCLAMNIAEEVAKEETAAIFSLEMTRKKIAARSLKYHESLIGRDGAVDHLATLKLHIDDSAHITIGHMRMRLARLKRRRGLGLVVVDYLQLMHAPKAENRVQEVSEISRGLKAIAKDFNVPVIAVSQLSRVVESRPDHRPQLSDLRDSGQIEQDADVIGFVYRDEYYKPGSEWTGIAEVIFRKNRDGAVGTAYLTFVPELTRFKPLDRPLPQREVPTEPKPRRSVVTSADFKKAAGADA
jgi:replicative DNA helicase